MKKRLLYHTVVCILIVLATSFIPTFATEQNETRLTRMDFVRLLYQTDLDNGGRALYFEDPTLTLDPAMPLTYSSKTYYFFDIPVGADNHQIISWAKKCNITSGTNYYFNPTLEITREEAAVMLQQYSVYLGYGINSNIFSLSSYSDSHLISDWAQEAMAWALTNKILLPTTEECANPKGSVSLIELQQSLRALNLHHQGATINRGQFLYLLYSTYLQTEHPQTNRSSNDSYVPGGPGTYHPADDVLLASQYTQPVSFAREYLHAARGMFYPGRSITKEEAITFLWRYAQFINLGDTAINHSLTYIRDKREINSWARTAANWAILNEVITLDKAGNFNPKGTISITDASILVESLISST